MSRVDRICRLSVQDPPILFGAEYRLGSWLENWLLFLLQLVVLFMRILVQSLFVGRLNLELLRTALLLHLVLLRLLEVLVELFEFLAGLLKERSQFVVVLGSLVVCRSK